ncbi:MAG: geranylgeranyl reductase family protein [Aquificales bacterium]|nr:geranylgeranyl reductase family protein [Aquificales bacterium]
MEKEREVIIVGAGPSGATAATILAQQGHDVLLLDRQDFPRDKICGDGIPNGVISIMNRLGMAEKIQAAEEQGQFNEITQVRLVSPKGYAVDAPLKAGEVGTKSYVAPRMYLDAVIQEQAVASGVEFRRAQAQKPILENGKVVGVRAKVGSNGSTQTVDFRSQLVIGADGVTSVIARGLRPKEEQHVDGHRAVALRAYIEDIEEIPHTAEFYLYEEINPGYAWIFSLGNNRANIGLGMRLDQFRQTKNKLEDLLQKFLNMPDIKKRLKNGGKLHDIATWQLNFGSQKGLQFAFDGAMLVGDAAGFINPITGGGIHNGMISAELAAKTAHEALTAGSTSLSQLKIYQQRCHERLSPNLRRSYRYQEILMRFPRLIDFLIRRGQENSQIAQIFLTKL